MGQEELHRRHMALHHSVTEGRFAILRGGKEGDKARGEHGTRAKHRRSRPGVTSVGSGRCAQQLGRCCKLLLPRVQAAVLRAGGVGMVPLLNAVVLKCDETWQAAPRQRSLAIARLTP